MDEREGSTGLDPVKFELSKEEELEILHEINDVKMQIIDHQWQMQVHQRKLVELLAVAQAAGMPLEGPEEYEQYGLDPNLQSPTPLETPPGSPINSAAVATQTWLPQQGSRSI